MQGQNPVITSPTRVSPLNGPDPLLAADRYQRRRGVVPNTREYLPELTGTLGYNALTQCKEESRDAEHIPFLFLRSKSVQRASRLKQILIQRYSRLKLLFLHISGNVSLAHVFPCTKCDVRGPMDDGTSDLWSGLLNIDQSVFLQSQD